MVRRILPVLILAALAVAWPAAAEGDATAPPPQAPSDGPPGVSGTPLSAWDPSHPGSFLASSLDDLWQAASAQVHANPLVCQGRIIGFNDPSRPVEYVSVDPDGCFRSFLRDTVDAVEEQVPPSAAGSTTSLGLAGLLPTSLSTA